MGGPIRSSIGYLRLESILWEAGCRRIQPRDWPSIKEIQEYNSKIRAAIDRMPQDELLWNVAIEHRLMHAETLAYMLHQMPIDTKLAQTSSTLESRKAEPGMITIPAGMVTLGLANGFGWDNEFDAHEVYVPEFQIDSYKVTIGDYLIFSRAGVYEDDSLIWLTDRGIKHPVFWKNESVYQTMFAEIPMPLDWPVYVSHSEASAYARWVGKSLPTEAEWQTAAQQASHFNMNPGNAGFVRWDPVPVTADSSMIGNGWEWTSTLFKPFPGFQPFPFYPGYSANFFDDQHYVMKGGSARTASCSSCALRSGTGSNRSTNTYIVDSVV